MTDEPTDDRPLFQRLGEDNVSDAALFAEFGDVPATPALVKVVRPPIRHGASYEETHWAELSPAFRAAYNRLRRMRGLTAIPEPAVDRYVPRNSSGNSAAIRPVDVNDREARAAAREFAGQPLMNARGDEGFTINGEAVRGERTAARPAAADESNSSHLPHTEGFSINGRTISRR